MAECIRHTGCFIYRVTYLTSNVSWCFCSFHRNGFSCEIIAFLYHFLPPMFIQFLVWKRKRKMFSTHPIQRHFLCCNLMQFDFLRYVSYIIKTLLTPQNSSDLSWWEEWWLEFKFHLMWQCSDLQKVPENFCRHYPKTGFTLKILLLVRNWQIHFKCQKGDINLNSVENSISSNSKGA